MPSKLNHKAVFFCSKVIKCSFDVVELGVYGRNIVSFCFVSMFQYAISPMPSCSGRKSSFYLWQRAARRRKYISYSAVSMTLGGFLIVPSFL